jgi:hypothetical protein
MKIKWTFKILLGKIAASILFFLIFGKLYAQVNSKIDTSLPNIIVFVADDAGWRDFGCYGNASIRTSNIDA